jgi:microcystin-dependent protein
MTFLGQNLYGMAKVAIGTENPGSEVFTVLGGSSYFDRDVTITGNLFVNGNTTTFTSNNITLRDSIIYLADNNPADTVDIGFVGSFNNVIRYQHTGFVRDATDGTWKLFANVVPEPTSNTIDFTDATYSNLKIGNLTAVDATLTGNINTSGNISAAKGNIGTLSVTGNITTTGSIIQNGVVGGIIPIGGIIMWSGNITSIPTNWSLCNGQFGTPDLRNQFVIGAYADSGGQANTTVEGSTTKSGGTKDAIVVSHTHTPTVTDPTHFHTYGGSSQVQAGFDNNGPFVGVSTSYNTSTASTGISVAISTTGSSGTNQNLPPYYALAYIMRTS